MKVIKRHTLNLYIMYFDIAPKMNKKDFFNYNREYLGVIEGLKRGERIIAVLGVRRVGKTSLMSVLFHEKKGINIWLDGRMIENPKKDVLTALQEGAKRKENIIIGSISTLNVSIPGIPLPSIGVEIKKPEPSLKDVKNITLFIDEAQRTGKELGDVLSYIYDRYPNVQVILSGSEIGLFEDILRENDPTSSLYGRHILKIRMRRLSPELSKMFLEEGFRQLNIRIDEVEITEVVSELDGLIGWLTYYGYEKAVRGNPRALEATLNFAIPLVAHELAKFLYNKRNRQLYISVLRSAKGLTWEEMMEEIGNVSEGNLGRVLRQLLNYGFLLKEENRYFLADPILRKALGRVNEFLR